MDLFNRMKVSICRIIVCRSCFSSSTSNEVRVRFAPSPTGSLHLGGLRTALFNFLFARSQKGKFILRIEDTDQDRVLPGSALELQTTLDEYGLKCDEGPSKGGPFAPYFQSQRIHLYKEAAEKLMDAGMAYRCFCSADRLELIRRDAVKRRINPRYDNRCRNLSQSDVQARLRDNAPSVVRFKIANGPTWFQDVVFGRVEQQIDEGDFVIIKSDGYPTYHMANVVDDHLMNISHVIRGMEWISSTPKHLQLYKAFGWKAPIWVHLPLITRDGRRKLSKREKDAFVKYYHSELGYLPLAVLNFLIRNGAGIRNFDPTHLYSLDEMITNFDLNEVGRRDFMLDINSLNKYGRMSFGASNFENELYPKIVEKVRNDLPEQSVALAENSDYVKKVVDFLHCNEERFAHLSSLTTGEFRFFFTVPANPSKLLAVFDAEIIANVFNEVITTQSWTLEKLKKVAKRYGMPYPKLLMMIRLALIDNDKGPPIVELFDFFGPSECYNRLYNVIEML